MDDRAEIEFFSTSATAGLTEECHFCEEGNLDPGHSHLKSEGVTYLDGKLIRK